jgi:hypothetical protein
MKIGKCLHGRCENPVYNAETHCPKHVVRGPAMTPQAKPKRLPKLPDVWVVFNQDGIPIACEFLGSNATRMALASDRIVRYAPSEPRKAQVCVWKWNPTTEFWESGCEMATSRPPEKFCPYCGGKIKVKS